MGVAGLDMIISLLWPTHPDDDDAGAISFLLHLDVHLSQIIAQHGAAPTYAILWAIVFCETGLVITPFLPGTILPCTFSIPLPANVDSEASMFRCSLDA